MNQEYISIQQFCEYQKIEIDFINSLHEHGLINIETKDENNFLLLDELPSIEKMIRFHYDMDINVPGIEALNHVLTQVEEMKGQISFLQNKLKIYVGVH